MLRPFVQYLDLLFEQDLVPLNTQYGLSKGTASVSNGNVDTLAREIIQCHQICEQKERDCRRQKVITFG